MKLLTLLFLSSLLSLSTPPDIKQLRERYIDAATSSKSADSFYKALQIVDDESNATVMAYKAASVVLLAKYEKGIISKTRLFNRGTDLLEETINKAPDNYEARLIRLNIQDNVPWITGYTSEIKEDKKFLIKNFKDQPKDLQIFTKKYISQSDAFSEKEKQSFN